MAHVGFVLWYDSGVNLAHSENRRAMHVYACIVSLRWFLERQLGRIGEASLMFAISACAQKEHI